MQNVITHWFLILGLVGLSQACADETNSATSGLTTPSGTADVIADAVQPEDSGTDDTATRRILIPKRHHPIVVMKRQHNAAARAKPVP